MNRTTRNPATFARWFNEKVPGAYRRLTGQDVYDMTRCGLIGRHDSYDDTVCIREAVDILNYELKRGERVRQEKKEESGPPCCRLCGWPLPPETEGKTGRPREYCDKCEPARARERNAKWRNKRRRCTE